MKILFMAQTAMVIFLFLITFSGCNKAIKENDEQYNEYFERYSQAFLSHADDKLILSTITYIDEIIAKEGDKKLKSIYYDKARLLYMLKRYDEALDTLYQSNDTFYEVYIATLLIRLERNNEAFPLLQNQININKKTLTETPLSGHKRNSVIQGLMACYILTDKSLELILLDMASENITTEQEAEKLLQDMLVQDDLIITRENILKSMWPEKETIP